MAKLLGRTTSYTAAEVAGAMKNLGQSGFKPKQIDTAIASVLSLARAADAELPEAASIAAGALRAFGLPVSDTGRVADVMTAAVNNSDQSLTDFGEAMKYAAPVADEFGMSLEETAKAVGALANYTIRGSMAGNVMKNMMLKMSDPAIRKRLEGIGVSVVDGEGNFRSFSTILADLGTSIKDMPAPTRLALLEELFGKRAIAGGAKLAKTSFDDLNNAIDRSNGVAQKTAEIMDSGIGGAMRRLWSAAEGTAIAIGEALAPALSAAAEQLGMITGVVTEWIEKNQTLVVLVLAITAGVLAAGVAMAILGQVISMVGGIMGVFAGAITAVITLVKVLAIVIGALLSPIGLVIAGVAALGGYLLHVSGVMGDALGWLGDKFGVLKDDALTAFGGISDALAAGNIPLAMKILWLTLKMEWVRGVNFLEKAWLNFRNFFIKIGHDAWSGLLVIIQVIWHALEVAWIETVAFVGKAWAKFVSFFARTWETLKAAARKAWVWIKGLFDDSTADSRQAAYDKIDREKEEAVAKIRDREMEKVDRSEETRAAKREAAAKVNDAVLMQIVADNDAMHNDLDSEYRDRMSANDQDLAAARGEWTAAIAEAKAAANQPKGDAAGDDGPCKLGDAPKVGDAGPALAGAAKGIGAKGSFNLGSILGLQAGGGSDALAKETLSVTKRIEKNTRPDGNEDRF